MINVINKDNLPTIPIAEVKPTQGKLKELSKTNYNKLKNNIIKRGFIDPISIWEDPKDGVKYLLNGHQRQIVLIGEGWSEPIPYFSIPAKTLKEAAQIVLELTSQYGKITKPGLQAMMKEYDLNEADVFEATSFSDLSDEEETEPEKEVVEDEVPEASSEPPVSELGKVYQLGRHRVMCGDSTKKEDVELLMNGEKADMVFTDPPYGVSYQSNMRTKTEKFDTLKNDDVIDAAFSELAFEYSTGWVLVCTAWTVLNEWAKKISQDDMTNLIVWHKGGGGMGDLQHSLSTDYELIMAYGRGNKIIGKRLGSVWSIGKDASSSYQHPTQKPVQLAVTAIKTLSNGSVLDLFLGSGSTLIACEQTDRTCYGMELDPKYVDVIRKRYAKFIQPDDQLPENWVELTPEIK